LSFSGQFKHVTYLIVIDESNSALSIYETFLWGQLNENMHALSFYAKTLSLGPVSFILFFWIKYEIRLKFAPSHNSITMYKYENQSYRNYVLVACVNAINCTSLFIDEC